MMGRKEVMVMLMAGLAFWSCDYDEIEVGKYQMVNETSDTVYVSLYGRWGSAADVAAAIGAGETYILAASDEAFEKYRYKYNVDSVIIYSDAERQKCVFKETRYDYYRRWDETQFFTTDGSWTERSETQKSGDYKIVYHTYTFRITDKILRERR